MLKQHAIPSSGLPNLKIYSSRGCRKASQRLSIYVANKAILKLRIFRGRYHLKAWFFTSTGEFFTVHTEEYYPRCHKVNDGKTSKTLQYHCKFCAYNSYAYCRLAHLTRAFKNHVDLVLLIVGPD